MTDREMKVMRPRRNEKKQLFILIQKTQHYSNFAKTVLFWMTRWENWELKWLFWWRRKLLVKWKQWTSLSRKSEKNNSLTPAISERRKKFWSHLLVCLLTSLMSFFTACMKFYQASKKMEIKLMNLSSEKEVSLVVALRCMQSNNYSWPWYCYGQKQLALQSKQFLAIWSPGQLHVFLFREHTHLAIKRPSCFIHASINIL